MRCRYLFLLARLIGKSEVARAGRHIGGQEAQCLADHREADSEYALEKTENRSAKPSIEASRQGRRSYARKARHQACEVFGFACQRGGCCIGFLDHRRVLLCHNVQITHGGVDFGDGKRLALG